MAMLDQTSFNFYMVFESFESLPNIPTTASPAVISEGKNGLASNVFIEPYRFVDDEIVHSVDSMSTAHVDTWASPKPIPPGFSSLLIGFFEIPKLEVTVNFDPSIVTTDGSAVEFTDKTFGNDIRPDIVYLA